MARKISGVCELVQTKKLALDVDLRVLMKRIIQLIRSWKDAKAVSGRFWFFPLRFSRLLFCLPSSPYPSIQLMKSISKKKRRKKANPQTEINKNLYNRINKNSRRKKREQKKKILKDQPVIYITKKRGGSAHLHLPSLFLFLLPLSHLSFSHSLPLSYQERKEKEKRNPLNSIDRFTPQQDKAPPSTEYRALPARASILPSIAHTGP